MNMAPMFVRLFFVFRTVIIDMFSNMNSINPSSMHMNIESACKYR